MPKKSVLLFPTELEIRNYWANTLSKDELARKGYSCPEHFLFESSCMACGWLGSGLHRAHIIPRHLDGTDVLSNLHILCEVCHNDSESLDTLESYWPWFWQRTRNQVLLRMAVTRGLFGPEARSTVDFLLGVVYTDYDSRPVWSHVPSEKQPPQPEDELS